MKRLGKLLLGVMLLSITLGVLPKNVLASQDYIRLAGDSRYQTAEAIAETYNNATVSNIILASGNDFADALSVSVLAKKLNAPILLVDSDTASSTNALNYVSKHMNQGTVWLAGGTGVIDTDFEAILTSKGNAVRRLSGQDRYETSVAIAKEEKVPKGTPVFIVSGENFPDALSITSVASAKGNPIILVPHSNIPTVVKTYLSEQQPSEVYIIGGTGVISASIESDIKSVIKSTKIIRIAGTDRYETASLAYKKFLPSASKVYVTSGNNFADALSASVLAAENNAPIVLTDPNYFIPPSPILKYLATLKNADVTILGGVGVVPELLADNIKKITVEGESASLSGFTLNSLSTDSSIVTLNGVVKPETTEVWIQTTLDGRNRADNTYTPSNGTVTGKIYFQYGVGTYELAVYEGFTSNGTIEYTKVKQFTVQNTDTRTPEELRTLHPSEDVQSDSQEIIDLANSITSGLSSDYAKVKAVHDWVAKNIAYDIDGYNGAPYAYDALGTLHARKSVCQGYADLSAALLRALDIKTKVVNGIAGYYSNMDEIRSNLLEYTSNHAWNEAYVDGRWLVFDTTWDAGYVSPSYTSFTFKLTHKYFDPDPAVFAKDHIKKGEDRR